MNRTVFFDTVRHSLFGGTLTGPQVQGIDAVMDEAERRGTPRNWLAYNFATDFHETNQTMQPVREAYWVKNAETWRKAHLRYYPWYGRGLVQLTWYYNYKKADLKLGLNGKLIANPDLAMDLPIAVQIMFQGMEEGWFTGEAEKDYIDTIDESDVEDLREFTNARRIINGTDKAAKIGAYAIKFEQALKAAGYEIDPEPMPIPVMTVGGIS